MTLTVGHKKPFLFQGLADLFSPLATKHIMELVWAPPGSAYNMDFWEFTPE